jgi:hypothetical protein
MSEQTFHITLRADIDTLKAQEPDVARDAMRLEIDSALSDLRLEMQRWAETLLA